MKNGTDVTVTVAAEDASPLVRNLSSKPFSCQTLSAVLGATKQAWV